MKNVIAVCGPTASGKSALALEICDRANGELVSCDSMQIYKHLDIGTAKPNNEEKRRVKHHMIDICMPNENCSSAEYAKAAKKCIDDIIARKKTPVVCGGTGLYLDSLLYNTEYTEIKTDPELRKALLKRDKHELWLELKEKDPQSASAIHENNVKRVARAIEIFYTTGMTKTELDEKQRKRSSEYDFTTVILDFHNREKLYERINRRCEQMISSGLVDEVKALLANGLLKKGSTAYQAIGYKELTEYLNGDVTFDVALENLKQATRNYAKRQITWFKRTDGIRIYPDDYDSVANMVDDVMSKIKMSDNPNGDNLC